jgi:deoxyadenosine/deoxycytidine kinase
MFMALNDYKPIYIRGPIYSGKTTIVKMLSVRLGRLLVTLSTLM